MGRGEALWGRPPPSTARARRLARRAAGSKAALMLLVQSEPQHSLDELITLQHGAVSRAQVLRHGLTDGAISANLDAGRWTVGYPGTYVNHAGPRSARVRTWLAVLYAGEGATVSHQSAAFASRLQDDEPGVVHVTVPSTRRVTPRPGLVVHHSMHLDVRRHPALLPPQTRVEHTVLDLVEASPGPGPVVGLVTAACQRRLTTAARLAEAAASRKKLRWRSLVVDVLADVRDGALSPLERKWARGVERAHGLPPGRRNVAAGTSTGRAYRDVSYLDGLVVVELDGRAAHPEELRHRDLARDNELLVVSDVRTLRYGWRAVVGDPCACAAHLAVILLGQGWQGVPWKCGPRCELPTRVASLTPAGLP